MNVIDLKHVEDCFDGSLIYEVLFDANTSKAMILALAEGGDIQYFANFAKPFFKIRVKGLYDLKGIEGHSTMRLHLKSNEQFTLADFLAKVAAIEGVPGCLEHALG